MCLVMMLLSMVTGLLTSWPSSLLNALLSSTDHWHPCSLLMMSAVVVFTTELTICPAVVWPVIIWPALSRVVTSRQHYWSLLVPTTLPVIICCSVAQWHGAYSIITQLHCIMPTRLSWIVIPLCPPLGIFIPLTGGPQTVVSCVSWPVCKASLHAVVLLQSVVGTHELLMKLRAVWQSRGPGSRHVGMFVVTGHTGNNTSSIIRPQHWHH